MGLSLVNCSCRSIAIFVQCYPRVEVVKKTDKKGQVDFFREDMSLSFTMVHAGRPVVANIFLLFTV